MNKTTLGYLSIVLIGAFPPGLFAQQTGPDAILQQSENLIVTTTFTREGVTPATDVDNLPSSHYMMHVGYFDGLGRPVQSVDVGQSPLGHDVVIPIEYDDFGREAKKYLPYARDTRSGLYVSGASSEQGSFYSVGGAPAGVATDADPWALTVFEPSPLNRVLEQGAPGADWQPDTDHTVKQSYEFNAANEVRIWTISYPAGYLFGIVNSTAHYAANALLRNRTVDEGGNVVVEYVDKLGRTVLKRVQAIAGAPSLTDPEKDANWASTYYIYDDFGSLVCVIPPEATRQLATNYFNQMDAVKEVFLQRWAFRYKYDHRRRMIVKQVPGAEPVYMVYDERDRLVLTQDGVQRLEDKWIFTKYDALNRPVMTGLYDHGSTVSQEEMTDLIDTDDFFETYNGNPSTHGYTTTNVFPTTNLEILTVTYYDNYDFLNMAGTAYDFQSNHLSGQDTEENAFVKGQVTATRIKVLEGTAYLWSANYYDEKYRLIQSASTNPRGNGVDRTTSIYDFVGKVMKSRTSSEGTTVTRRFGYDHAGRLLVTHHSVNGGPEVVVAANYYNELGQVIAKGLHHESYPPVDDEIGQSGVIHDATIERTAYSASETDLVATTSVVLKPGFHVPNGSTLSARIGSTQQEAHQAAMADPDGFRQVVDYRYNIRGWLENINDPDAPGSDDLFSMKLNYNAPTANGGDAQYNGNISETIWKTVGYDKQSYGYDYDPMNRILEADYFNLTNPAEDNRFNERIGDGTAQRPAYDLNGNILNLLRNSKKAAVAQGNIDNLTYKYIGNQLHVVNDATADHADEIGFKELVEKSFSETNPSSWEYAYDANGNMIRDDNKGITSIEYNHLNLPRKVSKSTSEYIVYTYDATGRKLKQEVFGPHAKVTHYAGEMIFEDNELQFINHEEGRVVMTGAAPEYQYHLKDHLGNVRLTLTSTPGQETAATAGFETADMAEEQGEFLHYAHARRVQATLFDRTNGSSPGYSQRLNGSERETYGLAKSLAVMPGDVVNAEVYVKYADPESSNWNTALTNLMLAIANNTGGIIVDGEQYATALTENDFPGVVNTGSSSGTVPKAFLNWMVFDADFQLLDGGFIQVSTAARETGADGPHERLAKDNIAITQPGYVYIYLSNENGDLVEVFFDDFEVEHVHGEVVQVDDYYPFGLAFNSYNRENSVAQDYKYNSKEEQTELNLGWLDYGARMYQPELGRFFTQDRFADKYLDSSPYSYGLNNPALYVDINGDSVWTSTQRHTDSNGNVTVTNTINITGKVLRQSSGKATAQGVATGLNARLNSQKTTSAPVKNKDGTTTTTITKINANFTAASSMNDVSSSDHLVVIVDNVTGKADPNLGGGEAGGLAALGGQIAYIENADAVETAFHEVGHNLGMEHPDSNNGNPMSYNGRGNNFSALQLLQTYNRARNGALNQGSNSAVMGTAFPGVPHGQFFSPTTTQSRPFMVAPDKRARIPLPLINSN